jgi:translation initiation factor IF-1
LAQNPELALPMSGAYARETIVFQVVQVLCAPGVAIIAFSWAKPEEIGANIVLAFAAGFSSEMFLMAVRGVVERMIHGGTRKVAVETQYQLPTTKPAEVAQPVDMPPNPALQVYSLSLVPLQNNQKVKFVRVRQLPDGTVIELLTAGTIKKIVGNNITVSCEIKGKPVDVVVARGDIAPAEQVGTQQDDLKG